MGHPISQAGGDPVPAYRRCQTAPGAYSVRMKTLLVPVDLSRASGRVCAAACALARTQGARIVLLHVVPPQSVMLRGFGFAAGEVRSMLGALEKREMHRLLALAARCEKAGVTVQAILRTGEPAATVVAKAASLHATMIVLGSHGHGAAYDLVVGSTTQKVLRLAKVPVLVVPLTSGRG